MANETADVVVIGLGAMGSAALLRLARAGLRAVGIDRFDPPHDRGSTHGESRITRLAVGEGVAYAPLVRRSHELWRELEAESGERLLLQTGGLILGHRENAAKHHGKADFVQRTIAVAEQAGIAHDVLDADEMRRRFPQFALGDHEIGFFEPSAGVVFPERCVGVQLDLARRSGAVVHVNEQAVSVTSSGSTVSITTDRRTIDAARVVMTAGAWTPGLAGGRIAQLAVPYRQTLHWFEASDPAAFAPGRFPVFIWIHGTTEEEACYGFPSLDGATVKVASERYTTPTEPDASDRVVTAAESAEIGRRHVAGRLLGLTTTCKRAVACLYTVTPDGGFLIDTDPQQPNVLVASACSGHGFKHSAAVGELLAARVTGATSGNEAFGLARFAAQPA